MSRSEQREFYTAHIGGLILSADRQETQVAAYRAWIEDDERRLNREHGMPVSRTLHATVDPSKIATITADDPVQAAKEYQRLIHGDGTST